MGLPECLGKHASTAAAPRMVQENDTALAQGCEIPQGAMLTSWTIGLSITHKKSEL